MAGRRRRSRRRRGGWSIWSKPNPNLHPWSDMEGIPMWRQRMIYGRGVRIENLKNYHLGYKYSPRLKKWVPRKVGKRIFDKYLPSKRDYLALRIQSSVSSTSNIMACGDKEKVWVHIRPHRKRVWKCFDEKPPQRRKSKKHITKPLNVADFARAPGYRRSERRVKKKKPKRIQLRPPPAAMAVLDCLKI